MKKETWVIVANSSQARIFRLETIRNIVEVETLVHPKSRLHGRDITEDKPGRAFESGGQIRHSMEPSVDPKKQEAIIFAKKVAERLEVARTSGVIEKLYIVASPAFLGLLRQAMSSLTADLISNEIPKDITHFKANEIVNHLELAY